MVDIDPLVEGPEFRWVNCFRRSECFSQSVCCIEFAENFAHAKVAEFELNRSRFCWSYFIPRKSGKNIGEMDVLMGELVNVQKVYSLEETSRDGIIQFAPSKLSREKS